MHQENGGPVQIEMYTVEAEAVDSRQDNVAAVHLAGNEIVPTGVQGTPVDLVLRKTLEP